MKIVSTAIVQIIYLVDPVISVEQKLRTGTKYSLMKENWSNHTREVHNVHHELNWYREN